MVSQLYDELSTIQPRYGSRTSSSSGTYTGSGWRSHTSTCTSTDACSGTNARSSTDARSCTRSSARTDQSSCKSASQGLCQGILRWRVLFQQLWQVHWWWLLPETKLCSKKVSKTVHLISVFLHFCSSLIFALRFFNCNILKSLFKRLRIESAGAIRVRRRRRSVHD